MSAYATDYYEAHNLRPLAGMTATAPPNVESSLWVLLDGLDRRTSREVRSKIRRIFPVAGASPLHRDDINWDGLIGNWLVRQAAPIWLRLVGLEAEARTLEALPMMTDSHLASPVAAEQPLLDVRAAVLKLRDEQYECDRYGDPTVADRSGHLAAERASSLAGVGYARRIITTCAEIHDGRGDLTKAQIKAQTVSAVEATQQSVVALLEDAVRG